MDDLTALYCSVDDFWKVFKEEWARQLVSSDKPRHGPEPELSIPEMMDYCHLFHQSNYRTFKYFYFYVCSHLKSAFPRLISYSRFVYLMKNLFVPLFAYLLHRRGVDGHCFH